MNNLKVAEDIFYGLQGEGPRMGHPSVFVRLGGCNLKCQGFNCKVKSPKDGSIITGCDTIFAANREHFSETWRDFGSYIELVNEINSVIPNELLYNKDKADIVITGGEPMLWYQNWTLENTISYYISRGHRVYIETNGTIPVSFIKNPVYEKVQFSISVKMRTSGERKEKRWRPEVVNEYLHYTKNSYFKFVLSKKTLKDDAFEIFDLLNFVPTYATVFCMPMGATKGELETNAQAVYEFALEHGFRYSDRIHVRIYNDRTGV